MNALLRKPVLLDEWRDAFVAQLRLREVRGGAIGDALAQVDAHCAESGQRPDQAFGDPAEYADTLADSLPPDQHVPSVRWWRSALLGGGTMLGAGAVLNGVAGLVQHTPAGLHWGALVGALGIAALTGAWTHWAAQVLRGGRVWIIAVLYLGGVAAVMATSLLLPGVVVSLPAVAMLLAGLAVLAAVWLPWVGGRWAGRGFAPDPVLDPRDQRDVFPTPRWLPWVLWGLMPALLVIAVLAVVLAS